MIETKSRSCGGGSKAVHLQGSLRNHPSRDPLRDPAALLTQEGNPSVCVDVTSRV
jgi:hypothetical protein